jgi:hypothetical protein
MVIRSYIDMRNAQPVKPWAFIGNARNACARPTTVDVCVGTELENT